jgi:hypothetical protein
MGKCQFAEHRRFGGCCVRVVLKSHRVPGYTRRPVAIASRARPRRDPDWTSDYRGPTIRSRTCLRLVPFSPADHWLERARYLSLWF